MERLQFQSHCSRVLLIVTVLCWDNVTFPPSLSPSAVGSRKRSVRVLGAYYCGTSESRLKLLEGPVWELLTAACGLGTSRFVYFLPRPRLTHVHEDIRTDVRMDIHADVLTDARTDVFTDVRTDVRIRMSVRMSARTTVRPILARSIRRYRVLDDNDNRYRSYAE